MNSKRFLQSFISNSRFNSTKSLKTTPPNIYKKIKIQLENKEISLPETASPDHENAILKAKNAFLENDKIEGKSLKQKLISDAGDKVKMKNSV